LDTYKEEPAQSSASNKKEFPKIHFYDQDFVDIYDQTWAWSNDFWRKGTVKSKLSPRFFNTPGTESIIQFEAIFSTFFLVYSNRIFPVGAQLDNFYGKQEENGAIRGEYSLKDGKPVPSKDNPELVQPPLFAWVEDTFKDETGLYAVPMAATMTQNAPRKGVVYPVDFNTQQAINALYMAELGDILNDKEISFRFKRHYFSLKTRINNLMWNDADGIYYDLDKNSEQVKVKTIASFWPLLAELPNEARSEQLIEHLKNTETFGTENPFPTLAANEEAFSERGIGFRGSVYSPFTFMVIKGLEKYGKYDLARECSIRHLYYMLDTLHPESKERGTVWEAYLPRKDGPERRTFPGPCSLPIPRCPRSP
jgi:neutral trehalase